MIKNALFVAVCGLLISFMCLVKDLNDIGLSLSSLVLTGFFGYLRHDDNEYKNKYNNISYLFNAETLIVLITAALCIVAFKSNNHNLFASTSSIFASAISGFFGVSVQGNLANFKPNKSKKEEV